MPSDGGGGRYGGDGPDRSSSSSSRGSGRDSSMAGGIDSDVNAGIRSRSNRGRVGGGRSGGYHGYGDYDGMMNALASARGGRWGGSRGSWGTSGGMTAGGILGSGGFRGYTPGQVRGLIGTGMGWTLGDEGLGWARQNLYEPEMQAHKERVRNAAQMRENALSAMHSQVGKMDVAPGVRQSLADAVNKGDLAALDAAGLDTSQMRATHNSGGLLGAIGEMFGTRPDDVETMPEATMGLKEQGYLDFNPNTGQWERQSGLLGPVAGVGLNISTGPIAKGVYEQTKSVPAAKTAGTVSQKTADTFSGLNAAGRAAKQGFGMLTGAPSPVGGALLGGISAVNNAARLSYAGIPAPDNPEAIGPNNQDFDGGQQNIPGVPINPATGMPYPGWVLPQWAWSQYA